MMVDRYQPDTVNGMGSEPDQAAGLDGQLDWPGVAQGGPMPPRRPGGAEGAEEGRPAGATRSPLSADVFTTFDELRDREGRLARDMQDLRQESHALEREMEELHTVTQELRHAVDGLDATVNESNERLEAQLAQLTREVQALRRRIPLQAARPQGLGPSRWRPWPRR
jgi:cell division protein FtsB